MYIIPLFLPVNMAPRQAKRNVAEIRRQPTVLKEQGQPFVSLCQPTLTDHYIETPSRYQEESITNISSQERTVEG
jgi:hypothetical protein